MTGRGKSKKKTLVGGGADVIHGRPHGIPGLPECSVAFGAPCPAGLALVVLFGETN